METKIGSAESSYAIRLIILSIYVGIMAGYCNSRVQKNIRYPDRKKDYSTEVMKRRDGRVSELEKSAESNLRSTLKR